MWKKVLYSLVICLFLMQLQTITVYHADNPKQTLIIEVEGDPHEVKEEIEAYHPFVEVVAVYDIVFDGLAVEGKGEQLAELGSIEQVKTFHQVQTYETLPQQTNSADVTEEMDFSAPEPQDLNTTPFTGDGVKVGVIDTGIDYNHNDLQKNYQGGYDLVDFDDDPMETTPEEGQPTAHGTHVAGIIAGNGEINGVAPDAEIYSYRALGPGGSGSSVQVLAAIEKAIEDEMDIINLSLGNDVNVPDYPTSMAVNRASELGMIVVIANGNSGPDAWTVGSPATADKSVSVGASTTPQKEPVLADTFEEKEIPLIEAIGAEPWELDRSYELADMDNLEQGESLQGKIAVAKRKEIPFFELALQAESLGAEALIIYNSEPGPLQASVENNRQPVTIPVASIQQEEGEWLQTQINQGNYFIDSIQKESLLTIAPFSSRGPVTVQWAIKPDISAPGAAIWSTVPGGYQAMDGTSMAAPHVAGAFAVLKEAHPDWTNTQLIGALKTTAQPFEEQEVRLNATTQGMGLMQLDAAVDTPAIISDPQLEFGKLNQYQESFTETVTIENKTEKEQTYYFETPERKDGLVWSIPQSFTIEPGEQEEVTIELSMNRERLEEGVHEGWLTLKEDERSYALPYIIVNQEADQPKTAGFEFYLEPFENADYKYQFFVTEPVKSLDVSLYHPETLLFERKLLEEAKLEEGRHEGVISKEEAGAPGYYLALITAELEDGEFEQVETMVFIEDVQNVPQ
ncbi:MULTISPECIES: S8 family serine peptidase [Oceanobacillus]|uniref:S8 family serine peptidase n=1 Tax=Oceanobacillus aidingensis TaxID=645964 RepID=A0ABV9JUD0_9BACI|nr:S8 family serine peptidase [Oceanobacillus oncorhynchi]MDM8102829.1 S8 family serine peptidase [Oceanobacillus oncorhynchi]